MLTMMEVRCCCKPEKLLGWMPANPEAGVVRFAMVDQSYGNGTGYRTTKIYDLPIVPVVDKGRKYLAIKAEGMDLETLRLIPSFNEVRT